VTDPFNQVDRSDSRRGTNCSFLECHRFKLAVPGVRELGHYWEKEDVARDKTASNHPLPHL
jgi:hypothetical protein